jgi:hypothetical protein
LVYVGVAVLVEVKVGVAVKVGVSVGVAVKDLVNVGVLEDMVSVIVTVDVTVNV